MEISMKNKFNKAAPTMTVKADGNREWRNQDGVLHRDTEDGYEAHRCRYREVNPREQER